MPPEADDRMTVIRHWLEADEKPRCQHCPNLADERSFMCEDCASQADDEVNTLTEQLAGAVSAARELAKWTQHHPSCARATSTAEACTCGLNEAWAALDAAEGQ